MSTTFDDLGISPWLVETLSSLHIKTPTAIQSTCIPQILAGRDCIGGARTGSGKTIAFALPILQQWSEDPFGIFALVLTPTRELAIQISDQFAALGATMDLKFTTVVGGLDMLEQSNSLAKRPHVVIATPGRLADIIRSNGEETVGGFKRCKYLVLDEADRLLNESFADELATCMSLLPSTRQTLLFTATVTDTIRQISQIPPKDGKQAPFLHEIGMEVATPKGLEQMYIFIPSHIRENYLYDLLTIEEKSCIIFTNRTKTASLLSRMLKLLDLRCTELHSKLSQSERLNALGRFRAGVIQIMVCTDVASRGLDIPVVEMVINYDLPRDPDDYIHRAGRTARAGRPGKCINFVTERDIDIVHAIEDRVGAQWSEYDGCKESRVLENLNYIQKAKRTASVEMAGDSLSRAR